MAGTLHNGMSVKSAGPKNFFLICKLAFPPLLPLNNSIWAATGVVVVIILGPDSIETVN